MALYKVQSNGKAPTGLQAGDEVVTGGGTYRILGVNADGSYRSALSNRYQTLGSYRGSFGVPGGQSATAQSAPATDAAASGELSEAKAALAGVQAARPGSYRSQWDEQLQQLYEQIAGRGKFSYDLGTDPVYGQHRALYQSAGRLAMQDTMGQAAALTGGYGSSYAQQSGQQAYNAYLQQLNELVPQLYDAAREQYDADGAALYERYALLNSREQSDYARYRDAMSDYYAQLADARSAYDAAADREATARQEQWKWLEYQADREDAANAQYWKQLAYADKQAEAAERAYAAQQNAAQQKATQKNATVTAGLADRSGGKKKKRNTVWTGTQAQVR